MIQYRRQLLFFCGSLILSIEVFFLLYKEIYHVGLIALWILTYILFLASLTKTFRFKVRYRSQHWVIFVICLIPIIVRLGVIFFFGTDHIHRDEFIEGFIATQITPSVTNFFNPQPENIASSVAQFPSLNFFIQSLYFKLLGIGFWQLKLSNMGYLIGISFLLYRLASRIYQSKITGFITILFYSFLAPALYFDTLVNHITASTFIFLLLLNCLEMYLHKQSALKAGLIGIVTGLNYLFYISSYIALPLVVVAILFQLIKTRSKTVLLHLGIIIIGCLLVLVPFTPYMLHHGFYPVKRFIDLNVVSIQADSNNNVADKTNTTINTLIKSSNQTMLSLVKDDIGGSESYAFGHKKLFEPITLIVMTIGFIFFLIDSLWRKKVLTLIISFSVILPIVSIIVSTPPPAFHRLTLAFPLLALVAGTTIHWFIRRRKLLQVVGYGLVTLILILNILHFLQVMQKEAKNPIFEQRDISVIKRIIQLQTNGHHFNKIYVAAYPGFALGEIYYFFDPYIQVETNYHSDLENTFNPNDVPYLYVVLWPQTYLNSFTIMDPLAKAEIASPEIYALFYRFR